jgi:hypothetical protein
MAVVRRDIGEHIHANGVLKIAGIEIREVVGPLRRDVVQQFFGKVAVRVNDANTMPEGYVLDDEISKQGSLASAGLSNDVDMLALVFLGYAKTLGIAPAVALSNDNAGF